MPLQTITSRLQQARRRMTHVPLEQKGRCLNETLQAFPLGSGRGLLPQGLPDFVGLPVETVVEEVSGVEQGFPTLLRSR